VTTPAGTPIHPQFCVIAGPSIRVTESEGRTSDRQWVVTGFAAASAVDGAAADASTGRDAT
jgi:hypothetical protein